VTDIPVVLFLCTHNAGRSLAARVLLDHYAAGRIDVRSAGSEPADRLNPSVVTILEERGLDPSNEHPKLLSTEDGLAADVIVTMGCGDTCPVYPGKRYVDWDLPDPAGQPVDTVRPIVDEIDRRVRALMNELAIPVDPDPGRQQRRPLIPLTCSLDDVDATEQIERWRHALEGMVVRVERPGSQQLSLVLAGEPARIGTLVAVAKAEKACCSFFEFSLDIEAEVVILTIAVPPSAESVLDGFERLASET
jgi:protein-tyrosine-phosphatase